MIGYMKQHEKHVISMLEKDLSPDTLKDLAAYHDRRIEWMQQERLAHLITMLFVCLFTLLVLGYTLANPVLACFILCALLLILSVAYVIHYYRLENGVQKWYELSDRIAQHGQS